ncbi:MAG: hypothetical protein OQK67_00030 [Chlorobium sp.]|nr:hypothetical protein [Chlorobium sp.]MCW8814533.1 hypothetical protein [Chlorobium sp.]MCW8819813.1 hypothetical protein [Ignavibacteriaceae bacterium]
MENEKKQLDPLKTIVGVAMFIPSIGIPVFFASVGVKIFSTIFNAVGMIVGNVFNAAGGSASGSTGTGA